MTAERPEFEDQLFERLLRTIGSVLLQQAETVNKIADIAVAGSNVPPEYEPPQSSPTAADQPAAARPPVWANQSPFFPPEPSNATVQVPAEINPPLPVPGLPSGEGIPSPDSVAPMPPVHSATNDSVVNATWPFPSPFPEPQYQSPDQPNLPGSRYSTDHEDDATVLSMIEQFGEEHRRWRQLIMLAFQRIIDDLRVDHAKLSSILRHFEGTRRSP